VSNVGWVLLGLALVPKLVVLVVLVLVLVTPPAPCLIELASQSILVGCASS